MTIEKLEQLEKILEGGDLNSAKKFVSDELDHKYKAMVNHYDGLSEMERDGYDKEYVLYAIEARMSDLLGEGQGFWLEKAKTALARVSTLIEKHNKWAEKFCSDMTF